MGKGGVGEIGTLGEWGIGTKEAAAELGVRGVSRRAREQGKYMKEERSFGGRRERRRQQQRGTFKIKLASSRGNATAIIELFFAS